jgi:hypothetical protein
LTNTNLALERFLAITRGIELGAVFKGTSVVDSDSVTLLGVVHAITSFVRIDTIKKRVSMENTHSIEGPFLHNELT